MKFLLPIAVASATALGTITAVAPGTAKADDHTDASAALAFIQKIASQYAIMVLRSFVDVTYENLTIEPGTNRLVVTGLKLWPELPWDQDALCEVSVDRLTSGDVWSFETLSTAMEMSGVSVPSACFDPDVAGFMASVGYDGLTVDSLSADIAYDLPSSGAEVAIQAAVADAADVQVHASFDYFWVRVPIDGYGDPTPALHLTEAEVAIDNKGLWERVEPMVGAQMGDLNAIPPMLQMMVGQAMSDGGQRTPTPAETAFVDNLSAEVGRFLKEKNRLVVTAAPEGGVWFDEAIFDSPAAIVTALEPKLSATPIALSAIIPPAEIMAATADGANPDDAARLKIGRALVTGVGAPLSVVDGIGMLSPLVEKWNAEAAALVASASAAIGEEEDAYIAALVALAGGDVSAMSTADAMEAELPLSEVLDAQERVASEWPGRAKMIEDVQAAIASGDIGTIRKMAGSFSVGNGLPRHYQNAYSAATVAAAAGDRVALRLRENLDRRFSDDDIEAWSAAAGRASSEALGIWMDGGLGALLSGQAQ
ncbi:MAG: hypothetical protein AAGB15_02295 [Pseudomonadota bacterium]